MIWSDTDAFCTYDIKINETSFHRYENMPMQYTENFSEEKKSLKKNLILLILSLKIYIVGTR